MILKKEVSLVNNYVLKLTLTSKENIAMGAVCNGRITTDEIIGFFNGKSGKDVIFMVDSHKSYIGIKKDLNVELKQVPRGKSMIDSVYSSSTCKCSSQWI